MERSSRAILVPALEHFPPLPPIYNFSTHLRQLSDAREHGRARANFPGDSILRRIA
jgi:hypothetical protein